MPTLAGRALRAGKAVFVEKPPCLTYDELDATCGRRARSPASSLFVGFNRRHAPLIDAAHATTSPAPGIRSRS